MKRDNLILWFQENYTELFYEMQTSNHNLSSLARNIYHSEGTVWTHTMMVMTVADLRFNDKILMIVGLLHDIGKPLARHVVEKDGFKKARFTGHEGISTFMSVSILNHMFEDDIINSDEMDLIISLISLHGTNTTQYNLETEIGEYLYKFRICDKLGAVRNTNENIQTQWDPRKFSKMPLPLHKNKGIMLCGLPCSGKSTSLKYYIDEGYEVISRDSHMETFLFVEKLFTKTHLNSSYNKMYELIHNNDDLLKEFNNSFERKIRTLSKSPKVVVDMTMLTSSSRRKMLDKLSHRMWYADVHMSEISTIKERNKERTKQGKYISDEVYFNMMKSFVIPNEIEGFKEVNIYFN